MHTNGRGPLLTLILNTALRITNIKMMRSTERMHHVYFDIYMYVFDLFGGLAGIEREARLFRINDNKHVFLLFSTHKSGNRRYRNLLGGGFETFFIYLSRFSIQSAKVVVEKWHTKLFFIPFLQFWELIQKVCSVNSFTNSSQFPINSTITVF